MRSGGNIRRSLRQRDGSAEFRGGAVRRRERGRERGRHRGELGGVDRERKSAPPLGVGRGRDLAEKHFAFAAARRPIAEDFHGEARARLAAQLALHDEFARVLAHALERGGSETAVRRRLAVGRAIRENLGEASRWWSDAGAALADEALVLAARQAEHDAALAYVWVATAAGEAALDFLTVAVDGVVGNRRHRHVGCRPHRDAHGVAGDDVAVDDIAGAGETEAERIVGEDVGGDVVAVPPVDLQAVGISFEAVAHDDVVVAEQDFDALRRLRVGVGRAKDIVGHQVEGRAARELEPVAVVEELVALHLVVDRGGGGGIAIAVVAREHHAGAAAIADDAVVANRIAARAVDQHADAEVANLQAADLDALGVDQSEAGIAGRAHVGAVLAGDGAGAGLRALVLDVAGAVQSDEFAAALPRRALDRHRTFDRRQRRSELDHVRRLTRGIELDAQAPGRRVVALDRPAQRAFAAVIGAARDAQHLGRRRRRALRAGMIWNRPKRNRREVTNGTCRHILLPKFVAAVAPHSPDGPFPRACTSRTTSARRRAILAYAGHITT